MALYQAIIKRQAIFGSNKIKFV